MLLVARTEPALAAAIKAMLQISQYLITLQLMLLVATANPAATAFTNILAMEEPALAAAKKATVKTLKYPVAL